MQLSIDRSSLLPPPEIQPLRVLVECFLADDGEPGPAIRALVVHLALRGRGMGGPIGLGIKPRSHAGGLIRTCSQPKSETRTPARGPAGGVVQHLGCPPTSAPRQEINVLQHGLEREFPPTLPTRVPRGVFARFFVEVTGHRAELSGRKPAVQFAQRASDAR